MGLDKIHASDLTFGHRTNPVRSKLAVQAVRVTRTLSHFDSGLEAFIFGSFAYGKVFPEDIDLCVRSTKRLPRVPTRLVRQCFSDVDLFIIGPNGAEGKSDYDIPTLVGNSLIEDINNTSAYEPFSNVVKLSW
jgi:predicted nucleotidyltransferase